MTPVAGVKVIVGNSQSQATGQDGSFSMQVPGNFQVNGVTPSDYVLALPTKGKSYAHSANDLDVVVVDKKQQEQDYKTLYTQLRKKYRQQTDELNELRQQCRDQLESLSESDVQYAATKVRLDSLQTLYVDYINNEEQIQKQIQSIAEELSITDYQTLDSLQRRIYDLKREGQWKSISELLSQVMQGNASAYLHQKLANKDRATEIRKAAEEQESAADRDLASAFQFMEEAIEAFKMQNLRDSVSHYYAILTEAAPDNWEYFNKAAQYEEGYMADYPKALDYAEKALDLTLSSFGDTHLNTTSVYNSIGGIFGSLGDYDTAFEINQKVLDIRLSTLGERDFSTSQAYSNLGVIYLIKGNFDKGLEYTEKALAIKEEVLPEDASEIAVSYGNLGSVYMSLEKYDKALDYFKKRSRSLF
ncbi:MAG: tetratricopeptide repeat protein [Bacteroidales bacterium]|nr:tetratricopeptide repeat protein [Bacteroidales bacterium]